MLSFPAEQEELLHLEAPAAGDLQPQEGPSLQDRHQPGDGLCQSLRCFPPLGPTCAADSAGSATPERLPVRASRSLSGAVIIPAVRATIRDVLAALGPLHHQHDLIWGFAKQRGCARAHVQPCGACAAPGVR